MTQRNLRRELEELQLIRCSLMPGEMFSFVLEPRHAAIWASLLDTLCRADPVLDENASAGLAEPPCQARFSLKLAGARIWFEVVVPSGAEALQSTNVSVRGEDISRDQQEYWQSVVRQKVSEVQDSQLMASGRFPVYELISLHLLPALHGQVACSGTQPALLRTEGHITSSPGRSRRRNFHALLTSHHLVSPSKRRVMQQCSSELSLTGFAKVGYPGIIYCEGEEENVQAFVRKVKAMQWLALRVRFMEPVESSRDAHHMTDTAGPWVQVEKIAEALEYLRKRGRQTSLTDLGIGTSSK